MRGREGGRAGEGGEGGEGRRGRVDCIGCYIQSLGWDWTVEHKAVNLLKQF